MKSHKSFNKVSELEEINNTLIAKEQKRYPDTILENIFLSCHKAHNAANLNQSLAIEYKKTATEMSISI